VEILVVILIFGGALFWVSSHFQAKKLKQRRLALQQKYGDDEIVDGILAGQVWLGMTDAMALDSWGTPVDVAKSVTTRKRKEVWKYNQTGRGRFRSRVTIEDGYVTGIDTK
jgi:hypothetical protein